MTPYEQILEASEEVDIVWKERIPEVGYTITYPVPPTHSRYSQIQNYQLIVSSLKEYQFTDDDLITVDQGVSHLVDIKNAIFLTPIESELKTLSYLNNLVKQYKDKNYKRVIAIGGGIILNISAYIAEQLKLDLVLVPTTIISMSDSSIGGKVRVNDIQGDTFIKHAYKSFYEPSQIILDPEFLNTLTEEQVKIGMAEIIKHTLYQSDALAEYLLSDQFDPFTNKQSLLKAILWATDLKRVCLEIDPEESQNGSHMILRAAHDISDQLEEESKLTLSHGEAVLKAMRIDLEGNSKEINIYDAIVNKLGI